MPFPEAVLNITGLPGTGKTTLTKAALAPLGFRVFRSSDVIRAYAERHAIQLAGRADYLHAHRLMLAEDPEAITRPILQLPGLVALDGLRVYQHAQTVRNAVGGERYRTGTLVCAPGIRFERVQADAARRQRDTSHFANLEAFLADERYDLDDPEVNMQATMDMHDLTDAPIDTSPPANAVKRLIQCHALKFLAALQ